MGSIRDKLKYLSETKREIRRAIVDKRQDITNDTTFREYAQKIRNIPIYDTFEGPYTIGPSLDTQILQTNGLVMSGDVTVEPFSAYEGPYAVDPSTQAQTLLTENKVLTNDVIVHPVPVYDGSYMPNLTSIDISSLPTKLDYVDGETIDLTGAVVKTFYDGGKEYGTVPLSELTITPSKARTNTEYIIANVYNSGQYLLEMLADWPLVRQWRKKNDGPAYFALMRHISYSSGPGKWWNDPILIADNEDAAWMEYREWDPYASPQTWGAWHDTSGHIEVYNGYYYSNPVSVSGSIRTADAPVYGEFNSFADGLDAIIADIELEHTDPGKQTITVSWDRIGDGATVSTDYDITVRKGGEQ